MGVVYLARHPQRGPAALKLVRDGAAADASFRARFRREVEAARLVRSPRVAGVVDADPDAEPPWLATSFVDGPTLKEAVDADGPMAGHRLTALAVALADALASIHRAHVVHRDLKPANILLTADTPVVIDFGIAVLREAPALTRTGMAVGTPGWMAPEQVRGRRCGPRTDVFSWGLVVAYAASGRLPFGRGRPDAVHYRVVHEAPDLPGLPSPLGDLVRAALTKDPRQRPDVAELLATLTAGALEVTAAGTTALGPTLTDRTEVVPTIVALGWGVDALPARPGGLPRSVPAGANGAPVVPVVPEAPGAPAPGGDPRVGEPHRGSIPRPARDERRGAGLVPAFWYAGQEHHTAPSLAAALQATWDDARVEVFESRDPIWLGELRSFLQAVGRDEADRIVAAGTGDAPAAATMARLILAIDPGIEPRVGPLWLTPEGLVAAAQAVIDGDGSGERLAAIGAARVLRLWRGLPGMERAAAIDERWHAGVESFTRRVAAHRGHAGWLGPAERQRASATLLLCAVHPDHDLRLARRLDAARRTSAKRQAWWAQLAADGQRDPAAAVLAVLTAERARSLSDGERQAARAADRSRRDAARTDRRRRRAAAPALQPRYVPLPRATSSVRRLWVLAVMSGALVVYLWLAQTFGDELVAHYEAVDRVSATAAEKLDSYREASQATWLATLLLVGLPAMHVATATILRRGAGRPVVRGYAGAAAGVDLVLGLTLLPAATMGGLVLEAALETRADVTAATPAFGAGEPWAAGALLLPFGLVAVVLLIRSCWRLGRVVLGRPLAGPHTPPPPPGPPVPFVPYPAPSPR